MDYFTSSTKRGLANLGNTCYLNSAVQALYACSRFRKELFIRRPKESQKVTTELRKLFASLTQSQKECFDPIKFQQVSTPKWFTDLQQQDSSEFLRHVLNEIHNEESEESFDTHKSDSELTCIEKYFGIKTSNEYTCLNCRKKKIIPDSRLDLVCSLPKSEAKNNNYISKQQGKVCDDEIEKGTEVNTRTKLQNNIDRASQQILNDYKYLRTTSKYGDEKLRSRRSYAGKPDSYNTSTTSTKSIYNSSTSNSSLQSNPPKLDCVSSRSTSDKKYLSHTYHSHNTEESQRDSWSSKLDSDSSKSPYYKEEVEKYSLKDIIAKFQQTEEIKDYFCDDCKKHTTASRECIVQGLPPYLIITMERFDGNSYKEKNCIPVDYPQYLNLTTQKLKRHPICIEREEHYSHLASIIHEGRTSQFGHYVCYAKDVHGEWFEFNDEFVRNCKAFEEDTNMIGYGYSTGYVLIYVHNVHDNYRELPLPPDLEEYIQNEHKFQRDLSKKTSKANVLSLEGDLLKPPFIESKFEFLLNLEKVQVASYVGEDSLKFGALLGISEKDLQKITAAKENDNFRMCLEILRCWSSNCYGIDEVSIINSIMLELYEWRKSEKKDNVNACSKRIKSEPSVNVSTNASIRQYHPDLPFVPGDLSKKTSKANAVLDVEGELFKPPFIESKIDILLNLEKIQVATYVGEDCLKFGALLGISEKDLQKIAVLWENDNFKMCLEILKSWRQRNCDSVDEVSIINSIMLELYEWRKSEIKDSIGSCSKRINSEPSVNVTTNAGNKQCRPDLPFVLGDSNEQINEAEIQKVAAYVGKDILKFGEELGLSPNKLAKFAENECCDNTLCIEVLNYFCRYWKQEQASIVNQALKNLQKYKAEKKVAEELEAVDIPDPPVLELNSLGIILSKGVEDIKAYVADDVDTFGKLLLSSSSMNRIKEVCTTKDEECSAIIKCLRGEHADTRVVSRVKQALWEIHEQRKKNSAQILKKKIVKDVSEKLKDEQAEKEISPEIYDPCKYYSTSGKTSHNTITVKSDRDDTKSVRSDRDYIKETKKEYSNVCRKQSSKLITNESYTTNRRKSQGKLIADDQKDAQKWKPVKGRKEFEYQKFSENFSKERSLKIPKSPKENVSSEAHYKAPCTPPLLNIQEDEKLTDEEIENIASYVGSDLKMFQLLLGGENFFQKEDNYFLDCIIFLRYFYKTSSQGKHTVINNALTELHHQRKVKQLSSESHPSSIMDEKSVQTETTNVKTSCDKNSKRAQNNADLPPFLDKDSYWVTNTELENVASYVGNDVYQFADLLEVNIEDVCNTSSDFVTCFNLLTKWSRSFIGSRGPAINEALAKLASIRCT